MLFCYSCLQACRGYLLEINNSQQNNIATIIIVIFILEPCCHHLFIYLSAGDNIVVVVVVAVGLASQSLVSPANLTNSQGQNSCERCLRFINGYYHLTQWIFS